MFLKANQTDQITLLSAYMKQLSDVECKKENFIDPNWKLGTFFQLVNFSQELKLPEIGHQNVFNQITFHVLRLSANKIKIL